MTSLKYRKLLLVVIFVFIVMILLLAWSYYENSKPMETIIDEALSRFDSHYQSFLEIEFHKNNPYVIYQTTNEYFKVALLESDGFRRIAVKEIIKEYPMIQYDLEDAVSWSGTSGPPGGTNILLGVSFDPDITQIVIESEDNQLAHIIEVDQNRSIWFRFLEERIKSPVIIKGIDMMGNEKYYHGPFRGD